MVAGPTTISDVFNPEILTEAVHAAFGQKTAFMGSRLSSLGVVVVNPTMPEGPDAIGQTIKVPYFGTLGEFVNNPDGSAITPQKVQQTIETGTISRDSLGFSVSRWAQGNAAVNPAVGDPYTESARQIVEAAQRAMDKACVTAAAASGIYTKDVYSSSSPVFMNWDLLMDAKFDGWGDEQEDVAGMIVHSQVHKDLMKLKDANGHPLLVSNQIQGEVVERFGNLPVVVSDRVPVTGSAMGSVTSSGTSPPVLTIAGTPLGAFRLVIDCVLGGAHQTATYRFSTDGGNTWSATITTAAAAAVVALEDTAIDSLVGVNGKTGLTIAFAAGTFNADNLYTSNTALKVTSLLVKKRSIAFWYAKKHLGLETDKDIRAHVDEAAMHLYRVAHRYRRMDNGTKPGVVPIVHNVTSFV